MYLQLSLAVPDLPAVILEVSRGYCFLFTDVRGRLVYLSVWFAECWAPCASAPGHSRTRSRVFVGRLRVNIYLTVMEEAS
jgi:hypothetical protein